MSKVNNFDVLKEMGKRNLDIRGFPLMANLKSANMNGKNGVVTMLVDPNTVRDLLIEKKLVGMLIVADAEQFDSLKSEMEHPATLIEALAAYAHTAWAGWMDYLFAQGIFHDDGTFTMPAWAAERWRRQAATFYDELSELEKESDRDEARKILAILNR